MKDEGEPIAGEDGKKTLVQCQNWCDRTVGCNSISYRVKYKQCYLKRKCVTPKDDSAEENNYDYKTYYKQLCYLGILLYIKILINYYAIMILLPVNANSIQWFNYRNLVSF